MYRWARQATSKWKYKYEEIGKWHLALMQIELGPPARSVCVHNLGYWSDHTWKQIWIELSCDRGSCMLAICSNTNTYPFSWPMLRQLGIKWWFYGSIGKQELASQPLAVCLDFQESSVRGRGRKQSHTSHTQSETPLAQTCTKLIEKEPRWNCLTSSWPWNVKAKSKEWHQTLMDMFDPLYQKNCIGRSSLFFNHSATKQINLPLTLALSFSIRPGFI